MVYIYCNTVKVLFIYLVIIFIIVVALEYTGLIFKLMLYCKGQSRTQLLTWLQENLPTHDLTLCEEKTLWMDGSLLCNLVNIVVPDACLNPHCHQNETLAHGQVLAYKYLGIRPAFSEDELNQITITPQQEKKLINYLSKIKTTIIHFRNLVENMKFCTDYVAKGMGLVVGEQNRKSVFFIYPIPKKYQLEDILVVIKGPYSTYGQITIPVIYQKRMQAATDYKRSLYMSARLNSISPTTQGTAYLRKLSLNYGGGTEYDIPIRIKVTKTHAKIMYIPKNSGIHEISLTTNGHNLIGSPFVVSVESPSNKYTSDYDSLSDDEYDTIVVSKKYIPGLVDVSGEKMLLKENGTLEKITNDNHSFTENIKYLSEVNKENLDKERERNKINQIGMTEITTKDEYTKQISDKLNKKSFSEADIILTNNKINDTSGVLTDDGVDNNYNIVEEINHSPDETCINKNMKESENCNIKSEEVSQVKENKYRCLEKSVPFRSILKEKNKKPELYDLFTNEEKEINYIKTDDQYEIHENTWEIDSNNINEQEVYNNKIDHKDVQLTNQIINTEAPNNINNNLQDNFNNEITQNQILANENKSKLEQKNSSDEQNDLLQTLVEELVTKTEHRINERTSVIDTTNNHNTNYFNNEQEIVYQYKESSDLSTEILDDCLTYKMQTNVDEEYQCCNDEERSKSHNKSDEQMTIIENNYNILELTDEHLKIEIEIFDNNNEVSSIDDSEILLNESQIIENRNEKINDIRNFNNTVETSSNIDPVCNNDTFGNTCEFPLSNNCIAYNNNTLVLPQTPDILDNNITVNLCHSTTRFLDIDKDGLYTKKTFSKKDPIYSEDPERLIDVQNSLMINKMVNLFENKSKNKSNTLLGNFSITKEICQENDPDLLKCHAAKYIKLDKLKNHIITDKLNSHHMKEYKMLNKILKRIGITYKNYDKEQRFLKSLIRHDINKSIQAIEKSEKEYQHIHNSANSNYEYNKLCSSDDRNYSNLPTKTYNVKSNVTNLKKLPTTRIEAFEKQIEISDSKRDHEKMLPSIRSTIKEKVDLMSTKRTSTNAITEITILETKHFDGIVDNNIKILTSSKDEVKKETPIDLKYLPIEGLVKDKKQFFELERTFSEKHLENILDVPGNLPMKSKSESNLNQTTEESNNMPTLGERIALLLKSASNEYIRSNCQPKDTGHNAFSETIKNIAAPEVTDTRESETNVPVKAVKRNVKFTKKRKARFERAKLFFQTLEDTSNQAIPIEIFEESPTEKL